MTDCTSWATDALAAPVADPAVAVIDAVQFATAVTRPELSTDATPASEDNHVTGTMAIVWPL